MKPPGVIVIIAQFVLLQFVLLILPFSTTASTPHYAKSVDFDDYESSPPSSSSSSSSSKNSKLLRSINTDNYYEGEIIQNPGNPFPEIPQLPLLSTSNKFKSDEFILHDRLFGDETKVRKRARPITDSEKSVIVQTGISVGMVEELVERDQTMIMVATVKMVLVLFSTIFLFNQIFKLEMARRIHLLEPSCKFS